MTDSQCWIDYRADSRTCERNVEGWYGEPSTAHIYQLKSPCPKNLYWTMHLKEWCGLYSIPCKDLDGDDGSQILCASVTKEQLQLFVDFTYGDLPEFNDPALMWLWKGHAYRVHPLIDLKAFIAQEFTSDVLYDLAADTW